MALSGEAVSAFIIAELGVNHDGLFSHAQLLVHAAHAAGADAVKVQTYSPELLDPPGPRRDMLKRLMLSREAHFELKEYAEKLGLEFLSTPFDVPSLRFLVDELKVKTLKIASGNLDNEPLLEAAAESGCRLIISTGGVGMRDILRVADKIRGACWLHCVSAYPVPRDRIGLLALSNMRRSFHYDAPEHEVGFSDHTTSLLIPALAVAMGATIIEKHLTLDRNADGPDHKASLEPEQFRIMVDNIREAELAMGDGVKRPQACEAAAMAVMAERKAWREQLPTS